MYFVVLSSHIDLILVVCHILELFPCTEISSILPIPIESISSATCPMRRFPERPSTTWRLKKLCALRMEKLTTLAGHVTIRANILLMPWGIWRVGLSLSWLTVSSPCVRIWPLSFNVPVTQKKIQLIVCIHVCTMYVCFIKLWIIF